MKIRFYLLSFLCVAVMTAGILGCAKKADPNKPIQQIQTEVQKMSLGELESNARAYANEIVSKKSEVGKVADQVKAISIKELLSQKAKDLKSQLSKLQSDLSAYAERYQIYAQKFQQLGGDVAKIKVQ